jgi:hypothetical protein
VNGLRAESIIFFHCTADGISEKDKTMMNGQQILAVGNDLQLHFLDGTPIANAASDTTPADSK